LEQAERIKEKAKAAAAETAPKYKEDGEVSDSELLPAMTKNHYG
jgi:hypothetical protein